MAAGLDAAATAGALLMAGACAVQVGAILAGRTGAPCGCFGARGRVGSASAGRAALLAGALALVPLLPREEPSNEAWLAIGLGFALLGLAALAVVVLALAREIGMLRLSVAPRGALEVEHEGPEVGARSALAAAFGADLAPGLIGLAVFTSEGCGLCRVLAPAVAAFGAHPSVALRTFDEVAARGRVGRGRRAREPVRGRAGRRRDRAREGHVQHGRAARVRAGGGGASPRRGARVNEPAAGLVGPTRRSGVRVAL